MALFDLTIDATKRFLIFDTYLEKHIPKTLRLFQHNEWYEGLEQFMKEYFTVYKKSISEYLEKSVTITDELRPIFEGEKNVFEKMFDNSLLQNHTLCRRRCKLCDLCCVRPQNHSGSCDCSSNHKCFYECSICMHPEMCSQHAGHVGSHLCNSKPHICGRLCELKGCKNSCIGVPNHLDLHRCSAVSHPCGENCSLFHICKRTCEIDQVVPHDLHNCGQKNCPFPCCLCEEECVSTCMSQDHLHAFSKNSDELFSKISGDILHFCSREHFCKSNCEEEGVCELESKTERRVWCNEFSSFPYIFVSQNVIRKKCRSKIPTRSLNHSGEHRCGKEIHTCGSTCPDCGTYCELSFGHEDVHSSSAHRNKEKCIYVSRTEGIEYDVEEESGKTTRKLKAGESAKPEFCDQCCVRKGRGHTHAMECKGGTSCLEIAQAGRASHSKDRYYPDLDRVYDLVECETYWRLKGWEPPVLKKSPEAQRLFALCPFYCAAAEHTDKVYCEKKIFHSNSMAFRDHEFPSCTHKSLTDLDIAFVLDCTGSMSSAFPQVKGVITTILNQYKGKELSNKFAIVGYTDHSPENGDFPPNPPVSVYPPSHQLKDFDLDTSLIFLSKLRATGGGPKYGEAMLDGMNTANCLGWRPKASRMYFILADDSPHGDIFYPGTAYPAGCPCGHDWKALLRTMKSNQAEVRFVKLSTIVNKTADMFRAEYGEGFEIITLESMANITPAVVDSIVAVIEHNLEFARE